MSNNPNLGLLNFNAYTKFCKSLSICSQHIEWKQSYVAQNLDRKNDGQPKSSIHVHWHSSHYAFTHMPNKNSNIQGRSSYAVKVIFHAIRKELLMQLN